MTNPQRHQPGEDLCRLEQQALSCFRRGDMNEAKAIYGRLLDGGIRHAAIYKQLATICVMQGGSTREVISHLQQALAIGPPDADTLINLGTACKKQGDEEAAISAYRQAIAIDPNIPLAFANLGSALLAQGNLDGAIESCRQALTINPNHPEALYNLGTILDKQGDQEGAIAAYERCLAVHPDYAPALLNLGNARLARQDLQGAIDLYNKAIPLTRDDVRVHAHAHFCRSTPLFMVGDYSGGWEDYEWRFRKDDPVLFHAHPGIEPWDGSNLAPGEQLTLVSEQGLGDTLQFMRYVPFLNGAGMPTALCAQVALHSLVRTSRIATTIYLPEEAQQITKGKWCPLLSVPGRLGVSPERPIVDAPYIKAPEQHIRQWRQKLAAEGGAVVGINWQGNPKAEHSFRKGRSFPLQTLAPLAEVTGVRFLSLQKGPGAEQLVGSAFRQRLVGCQAEIDAAWDFAETAAIVANCDLVITVDTALAHLAGGMGQPTWLLLKAVPDWRWGLTGETSFWYPSMRLFRQRQPQNWPEVVERIATALKVWVAQQSGELPHIPNHIQPINGPG